MEREFACPVCERRNWWPLGRVQYRRGERVLPGGDPLTEYALLRRRVLFEVWFPGRDTVTLETRLCGGCGLITYSPRPSPADLDAKYQFLKRWEQSIGGSDPSAVGARLDRRRAEQTEQAIVRVLGREPRSVLDFGGGDGKLLAPFVERGVACAVVDYNPRPRPGVMKLGDTLEALSPQERFEAIICSHVLEHLANPATALRTLVRALEPHAVLFSEVPLEIWKGIPIESEPVTHLNFFTLGSLVELHARSGLETVVARSVRGSYGAVMKPVAIVIATPNADPASHAGQGIDEAERLLKPRLRDEVARAWRERRLPTARGIARRLGLSRGAQSTR